MSVRCRPDQFIGLPSVEQEQLAAPLVVCRSRITTGRAVVAASKNALKSTLRLVLTQPGHATSGTSLPNHYWPRGCRGQQNHARKYVATGTNSARTRH